MNNDCRALAAAFPATYFPDSCCYLSFPSIQCNQDSRIVSLDLLCTTTDPLSVYGITFPSSLTLLSRLESLDLGGCNLSGSLPNFATMFPNLIHLNLVGNHFFNQEAAVREAVIGVSNMAVQLLNQENLNQKRDSTNSPVSSISALDQSSKMSIVAVIGGGITILVILVVVSLVLYLQRSKQTHPVTPAVLVRRETDYEMGGRGAVDSGIQYVDGKRTFVSMFKNGASGGVDRNRKYQQFDNDDEADGGEREEFVSRADRPGSRQRANNSRDRRRAV
ncbi:UNVERIFIED_CONTAM: hypothetical protein HDU68_007595 [Siphonaria sp. JEL0065]|nr:hypothetical protein HDU68_007595 [Siphonaria sp. JEL0065]